MKQSVNQMVRFPSIDSFTHLVKAVKNKAAYLGIPYWEMESIEFEGTCKLHGTNASVIINTDGSVVACSRSNMLLSHEQSHFGFYDFVNTVVSQDTWRQVQQTIRVNNGIEDDDPIIVYGEWVGKGIQKGVALAECPKHFVIFHAYHSGNMLQYSSIQTDQVGLHHINEIPAYSITVDFKRLEDVSVELNAITDSIDAECPWAKAKYGVVGTGEGVVWYPKDDVSQTSRWFKTKGESHSVRKNANRDVAPVDFEKVNNINECVDIMVTEARMLQMIFDNDIQPDMSNTGKFLKAVSSDCHKEEINMVIENGLEWRDVNRAIEYKARNWFKDYVTRSIINS